MRELPLAKLETPKPTLDRVSAPSLSHTYRGRAPEGESLLFARRVEKDVLRPLRGYRQGKTPLKFEEWNHGFRSGMRVVHPHFGAGVIMQLAFDPEAGGKAHVAFAGGPLWIELESGGLERDAAQTPPQIVDARALLATALSQSSDVATTLSLSWNGLSAGDRVRHTALGDGVVTRFKLEKETMHAIIDFDRVGRKKLNLTRHSLERAA
jgi:hypothetical protein